ncbi:MAG: hypothetical protein Q4D62_07960 [Planctomycetia bacterium]|nr:hypothetical protein [Planctomycetia bacterium]
MWKSVRKYLRAVAQWKKAGKPTRRPAEIARLFAICQQCEHFRPVPNRPWRGQCDVCGCYLGRHPHKLLDGNKIAMETEDCPKNKWKKEREHSCSLKQN